MTDATKRSEPEILNLQKCASPKIGISRSNGESRQTNITRQRAPASPHQGTGAPVLQEPRSGIAPQCVQTGELDCLYRSLSEVTPENHPRTARLLASSTRKPACSSIRQKTRRTASSSSMINTGPLSFMIGLPQQRSDFTSDQPFAPRLELEIRMLNVRNQSGYTWPMGHSVTFVRARLASAARPLAALRGDHADRRGLVEGE